MTEPAGNAAGEWDALVIGAGGGGLFTAARLAQLGCRTLVVERLDKVGGRASTDDIDGFKVNNGVKEYANGGTTACAETAKLVADQIAARFPLAAQPEEGI